MSRVYRRISLFALLALLAASLSLALPAQAAPVSLVVTKAADTDDGTCNADCSLREALLAAEGTAGTDRVTITFSNGTSTWRIQPTTPLPPITRGNVTIDAGTTHRVIIDGSLISTSNGITINSSGNIIKGLVIVTFRRASGQPSTAGGSGVLIGGAGASNNQVIGNYIGVESDGSTDAGNNDYGVLITQGADNNTIGGSTAAERNVIAGNEQANVAIDAADLDTAETTGNTISGNYIGTTASGTAALSDQGDGVFLGDYARDNQVGPNNVISGHSGDFSEGVVVAPSNSQAARPNLITGNLIGTQANGTSALPNRIGVQLNNSSGVVIDGNTISGNAENGIRVDTVAANTVITNNRVGLNSAGSPLGNGEEGIFVTGGTSGTAGATGTIVGPGNIISASGFDGIRVNAPATVIKGNWVGTNASGTSSDSTLRNGRFSIWLDTGAGHVVGGSSPADRNIVSIGGQGAGVRIARLSSGVTPQARVEGNYIGLNKDGTPLLTAADSSTYGIEISGSSSNEIVNNVISANSGHGVGLLGSSTGNQIIDNKIGTDVTGSVAAQNLTYGNRRNGIRLLDSSSNNTISGNIIANNGNGDGLTGPGSQKYDGILIQGSNADNNLVEGNLLAWQKGTGVVVNAGTGNRITRTETRNNDGFGIFLLSGGNNSLQAPQNLSISGTTLSGTACAGCTIEVFTSPTRDDNEGPYFLKAETISGSSFSFDVTGCEAFLTATATDSNGNTSQFSAPMVATCASPRPNVNLSPGTPASSSSAPNDVVAGGQIVYQHTLTNDGDAAGSFSISAASNRGWSVSVTPASVNLNTNQSTTIQVTVNVPAGASPGTVNETIVTASAGSSAQARSNYTRVKETIGPVVGLSDPIQTKSSVPTSTPIEFTHTVRNDGDTTGTFNVQLTNSAPSGWAFQLVAPTSFSLAPGAEQVITLRVTMPTSPAPDAGTQVTAQLRVTAGSSSANASDTVEVEFAPNFSFSEASISPAQGFPGETVVFTHTLTNNGNGSDTFSIGVSGLPAGWSAEAIEDITLARGASSQVEVRVTIGAGADAQLYSFDVTASRTADPPDSITRTDQIEVLGAAVPSIGPSPDSPQNAPAAGSVTLTFSHTLTNTGNQSGTFTLAASGPAGWGAAIAYNDSDPQRCVVPIELARDASCTFLVEVTVPPNPDGGANEIVVTATADGSDTAIDIVNVEQIAGVTLDPDDAASVDPGGSVVYTLTLENTGNGTDVFTMTAQAPAEWVVAIDPISATLSRAASTPVEVTVTAPTGVPAGDVAIIITATSGADAAVSDTATLTTTLNAVPGAELQPESQEGRAAPGDTDDAVATYTLTLTNTGSTTIDYILAASTDVGWTTLITETTDGPIAPGAVVEIAVSVRVPAGTPQGAQGITTVRVLDGSSELDTATITTTVGPRFGLLLEPPLNVGTALPGTSTVYTHTLTNIGGERDIFSLSVANDLGWEVFVTPRTVDLLPDAQTTISVSVVVPTTALSNTLQTTTVIARSAGDPNVTAQAQERTTVLLDPGVSISPQRVRTIAPGRSLELNHTLVNTGNGVDTFTLSMTQELSWTISLTPTERTLGAGRSYAFVRLEIEAPLDIKPGDVNRVTITATSQSDPSVSDTTDVVLFYTTTQGILPGRQVYLPAVTRLE